MIDPFRMIPIVSAATPREGLGRERPVASSDPILEATAGGGTQTARSVSGEAGGPGTLSFVVHGTPVPQGSHKGYAVGGRAVITNDNAKTRPYRADVTAAAVAAKAQLIDPDGILFAHRALAVEARFWMPRPKGHYRTGRNAHLLRDGAPAYPTGKPDTDKLGRLIGDALTAAGVWRDDSQVVDWLMSKRYTVGTPSATITVHDLGNS